MSRNREDSGLFRPDRSWQFNACLNYGLDNWTVYSDGYKEAAGILVRALLAERATLDSVVYPLVFLYRQYLELRLKQLARDCSRLLEVEYQLKATHRLDVLWTETRRLLHKAEAKWSDQSTSIAYEVVDQALSDFVGVDSTSMAFRYPEDRDKVPHNPDLKYVNIVALANGMHGVQEVLEGAAVVLGIWLDWQQEMYSSY